MFYCGSSNVLVCLLAADSCFSLDTGFIRLFVLLGDKKSKLTITCMLTLPPG